MLQSQINRIIKNKYSLLILILFIIFPSLEIIQLSMQVDESFDPNFAFFLMGSSKSHMFQIIYLWFLPIYLLLITADCPIEDEVTGYKNIIISKISRKAYIKNKFMQSFILCFVIFLVAMSVNLLLCHIVFYGGEWHSYLLMDDSNNKLLTFGIQHTIILNVIYIFITSLLTGLCGMMATSLSIFFKNKKYTYTSAFFIWYILLLGENSIMLGYQPIHEYPLNIIFIIYIRTILIFTLIPLIIYFYEVKYVEL